MPTTYVTEDSGYIVVQNITILDMRNGYKYGTLVKPQTLKETSHISFSRSNYGVF